MAGLAAKHRAVVITGTKLTQFEEGVVSQHQLNNERGEAILSDVLIRNAHPAYMMAHNHGYRRDNGLYCASVRWGITRILIR